MFAIATIVSLKGLRRWNNAGAHRFSHAKGPSHSNRTNEQTMKEKIGKIGTMKEKKKKKTIKRRKATNTLALCTILNKKEESRAKNCFFESKRYSCDGQALVFARRKGPLNDRHTTHGQHNQHDLIYIDYMKIQIRIEPFCTRNVTHQISNNSYVCNCVLLVWQCAVCEPKRIRCDNIRE